MSNAIDLTLNRVIEGTALADLVQGTEGHDEFYGVAGNDVIHGGAGHDYLDGGAGNDILHGGEGFDRLFGGDGRDFLYGGAGHDVLYGGAGNDVLVAGAGFDILDGGEGSDLYLVGLDGIGFVEDYRDTGTTGRDRIKATADGAVIGLITGFDHATSGIEVIASGGFADVTIGGTNDAEYYDFSGIRLGGIRMINTLDGHDSVVGNEQNNRIDLGAGNDFADGADGHDRLWGGDGNDILLGGAGRDRLDGGAGNDIMDGGADADFYWFDTSSTGFDTIVDTGASEAEGGGRDRILAREDGTVIGLTEDFSAANGIEVISARRNDNVTLQADDVGVDWDFTEVKLWGLEAINGGDGMDTITGSAGRDTINGGAGSDTLDGGRGRDTLNGGADSDFLFGGQGRDTLLGGDGNDTLHGGTGNDFLTGGSGRDVFVFEAGDGRDRVTDFTSGEDVLDLSAFGTTFEDIQLRDTKHGVRIDVGDVDIFLVGLTVDDIAASDFVF